MDQFDVQVSDGAWHEVSLEITMDSVKLTVDNLVMSQTLARQIRTGIYHNNLSAEKEVSDTIFVGCNLSSQ